MSVSIVSSQNIREKQPSGLSAAEAKQAQKSDQQEEKIKESRNEKRAEDKHFDVYDKTLEKSESDYSGIYHVAEDEDGGPKIIQDAPVPDVKEPDSALPEDAPKTAETPDEPEEELCTANTDQVDAEIKKLKEEVQQLEQQLNAAADEAQKTKLESRLASVEAELQSKDNAAYRKQHTNFTNS